jgi:hypothetical protein
MTKNISKLSVSQVIENAVSKRTKELTQKTGSISRDYETGVSSKFKDSLDTASKVSLEGASDDNLIEENWQGVPLASKTNQLATGLNDYGDFELTDGLQSAGSAEEKVADDQDPNVSAKLSLDKQASVIMNKFNEANQLGAQIIEKLQSLSKSAVSPTVPQVNYASNRANENQVKTAMADMVEEAIYSAELLAMDRYGQAMKLADAGVNPDEAMVAAMSAEGVAPEVFGASDEDEETKRKKSKLASATATSSIKTAMASMVEEAIYSAEILAMDRYGKARKLADAGMDPEAALGEAMSAEGVAPAMLAEADAASGDSTGDPEADAQIEAIAAELSANGVTPEELIEALESGQGGEGLEGGGDPAAEGEAQAFMQQMAEQGVAPEEVDAAQEELAAEEANGIPPEAAIEADMEAAKTGFYKFASFIGRPTVKSASETSRAAIVRSAVRDFIYGPDSGNIDFVKNRNYR